MWRVHSMMTGVCRWWMAWLCTTAEPNCSSKALLLSHLLGMWSLWNLRRQCELLWTLSSLICSATAVCMTNYCGYWFRAAAALTISAYYRPVLTFSPRCIECTAVLATSEMSVRLSVRPCARPTVRLSNAWIVTKRKKLVCTYLHRM